jgi:hypothetical protein
MAGCDVAWQTMLAADRDRRGMITGCAGGVLRHPVQRRAAAVRSNSAPASPSPGCSMPPPSASS